MENEAVEKARAQIVKAAQKMAGQNMLPGSWGNISIKINENAYAITPSGRGYDNLTPDDITIVDAAGQTLDGTLIPSSELPLHLAIYKALPEALVETVEVDLSGLKPQHFCQRLCRSTQGYSAAY